MVHDQILELLAARQVHFLLESGHHGDLWLDLETLCEHPRRLQPLAERLAEPLAKLNLDAVCGPLVEGAFVALMIASHLDVRFIYSERFAQSAQAGLFPAGYRVPESLRPGLRDRRVAIVNDVINAGSAVRGTLADLDRSGARVVAISSLLVLGGAASEIASSQKVPLFSLASLPSTVWSPSECPLCAAGAPLEDVAEFATRLPTQAASG